MTTLPRPAGRAPFLRIFGATFLVSLLGSLPVGVLNTTASRLAVTHGLTAAGVFSLGAILVEVVYALVAMLASARISSNRLMLVAFEGVSSLVLVGTGIWYLLSRPATTDMVHAMMAPATIGLFLVGVSLSTLNFIALPFWLFWGTNLLQGNAAGKTLAELAVYALGIAVGTLAGFLLFILAGHVAADRMLLPPGAAQTAVGCVLIGTAALQIGMSARRTRKKIAPVLSVKDGDLVR